MAYKGYWKQLQREFNEMNGKLIFWLAILVAGISLGLGDEQILAAYDFSGF